MATPLDRRQLLATAGAAAVAALAPAASGTSAPATLDRGPDRELEEVTVVELARWMAMGRASSEEITAAYLRRIEALDHRGPALRSVIEVNPEALALARALDAERERQGVRGPLHGIPVLLKDNLDTADQMLTTAGSLALTGTRPTQDATVAAKLRAAGAVILGKTNLSEWANFRSTRSTSGWSARGGQTKNPYALDRNPCGSSSGSGAAIAANLAAVAIGTETDGSIVCPSTMCGLVGLKPTLGLVSRAGIIPIAHSQDTAGPMTRTVEDAALVLAAIAGADPRDPATARAPATSGYTEFLRAEGLRGARLGVVRRFFGFHPEVDRRMEEALAACKAAGAEIIDPVELTELQGRDEGLVLRTEFKADLAAYLATRPPGGPRTLADLITFNEAHAAEEMPWFGQELFHQSQEKGPLTDPAYLEALARGQRLAGPEGIDAALAKHRLDALVAPTGGPAWLTDLVNGDHYGGGYSSESAVAGYPHITVPAGFVHGLPVGVSFFAGAWSEAKLLRLAYAFESATRARRRPEYLATVTPGG